MHAFNVYASNKRIFDVRADKKPHAEKSFEELRKSQQDRRTAELRGEYESQAIVQVTIPHFSEIEAKDAAFVLKKHE